MTGPFSVFLTLTFPKKDYCYKLKKFSKEIIQNFFKNENYFSLVFTLRRPPTLSFSLVLGCREVSLSNAPLLVQFGSGPSLTRTPCRYFLFLTRTNLFYVGIHFVKSTIRTFGSETLFPNCTKSTVRDSRFTFPCWHRYFLS